MHFLRQRHASVSLAIVLVAGVACTVPAAAWGPKTQLAIVTNALHLLSKTSNIPLNRLERHLREGAMVSMADLETMYPGTGETPGTALESEMYLLETVQKGKVDPYLAFRLGTLGKLVAEAVSPMRGVDATYRNLYFADVERHIGQVQLVTEPRNFVDPDVYFDRRVLIANTHNEMLVKEYRSGVGFGGVARATLDEKVSTAVNTVADVWHTLLTGPAVMGNVSDEQLQNYVVNAYDFYINRRNTDELAAIAARLRELVELTPDMRVRIGDMFYEAELFERAMEEYQAVLAMEPDRRDVVEKIAEYHVRRGKEALENDRLETALEAFEMALDANALHPEAEALRMAAQKRIDEREARLASNRGSLERAEGFVSLAEEEALSGRYAEAIALLRQANDAYADVSDEFPTLNQRRITGQNTVRTRIQDLKQQIMANAQSYSGSGFTQDAAAIVAREAPEVSRQALRRLVEEEYQTELDNLEAQLQSTLAVE